MMFGHPDWLECVLCHDVNENVAVGLMAFDDGGGLVHYGKDPRCKDHHACRERVERTGQEWPLVSSLPTVGRQMRLAR